MLKFCLPWPYAANQIVRHELVAPFLYVWVTFEQRMDQTVQPADNLWTVDLDGVPTPIFGSFWQDQHTILLGVAPVAAPPGYLDLSFAGPDKNLRTVYMKQWEPFTDARSQNVQYNWRDLLTIDLPNHRLGIIGSVYSATLTHTIAGPTDDLDVTSVNTVFLDCSANDITIGGLVGGVDGHVLYFAKLCTAAHDVTLEHNEGTPNQNLFLHAGIDETLHGEYGGWTLACDGSDWYDISHSKHV